MKMYLTNMVEPHEETTVTVEMVIQVIRKILRKMNLPEKMLTSMGIGSILRFIKTYNE
jgi:hypothetical protein